MMMFGSKNVRLETSRLLLRLPKNADFIEWAKLRSSSRAFLTPWEPEWDRHHLTKRSFSNRVFWAHRSLQQMTAVSVLIFRRDTGAMVGALTVSNIRQAAAQTGTLGYWIGQDHLRQGFMEEALRAMIDNCFRELNLSRIEAACLPENTASRCLLEKLDFVEEGVADAYLKINGRWRTHVLYGKLRADRFEAEDDAR